ncbi:MAG: flagellar FliJ family protein [Phenylobacterium sp.]|uniref:flagellar FliJ family protein n=1 Tax=Phenylobacterium sp. TaxID=1871053 RepID=UPI00391B7FCB
MSWDKSLVRLSTYEVEVLQKRLAEIADRRARAELALTVLIAEGEAEAANARTSAEAGWYHIGFMEGLRARKAEAQAQIDRLKLEEAGAREALTEAFEEQKKYEQVSETLQRAKAKERARIETAQLDEIGLRRAAAGR